MAAENQVAGVNVSGEEVKEKSPASAATAAAAKLGFVIRRAPEAAQWLKFGLYGEAGVGKTTLASTAQDVPGMQNVIYIDAEGGSMSLRFRNDIDVIRITAFNQLARIHEWLRLHCQARDEGNLERLRKLEALATGVTPEQPKIYKTVVLDSLTEIQKYCMYQLLGIEVGKQPLDVEPEKPQWDEWNTSHEMVRLLVRSFRDLPMHVIVVIQEALIQDQTRRLHRRPNLPGKLANEILGFMDAVGYLVAASPGEDEGGDPSTLLRRLYLRPGKTFQAKNRFVVFKEGYIDNPTMAKVVEAAQLKLNQ